jgi:hypothetical protein
VQVERLQPTLSEKLGYSLGRSLGLFGLGCISFGLAFAQKQFELTKKNTVFSPLASPTMDHTPWVERSFNFDFPVTHFPFIAERLRGTVPRIEELIAGLNEVQLSGRKDGKWSLKEHIGHLTDLEELHEARIDDFMNKAEVLRAADMSNKKTEAAHHNDVAVQVLLENFRDAREHFIKRLCENNPLLANSALHPRLKKQMRMVDMAFFVAEHDDHHLVLMRNSL